MAAGQPTFFGLQAVLTILVIVLFTITFVVQAFRVPSESMENTLLVGDFLLADKLHFGDGSSGGSWSRILPYRAIQHGDIIVFQSPVEDLLLVKRVIGLPGDHIHMRAGVVYRNGIPLHEHYVIHTFPYFNFYRDNFPTQLYVTADVNRKWRRNMTRYMEDGDLVVPHNSYFVMGDNRDRSLDSRYWGFVPRGNVLGRPLVIYMSVTDGQDQG
ncbi:MAG: signal peptidase I, partial [Candidatus Angelobacter sp.]